MSLLCVGVHKVIPTEGHETSCCHHTATAIETPEREWYFTNN